jgi:hypothetical protein
MGEVSFEEARVIRAGERDARLDLHARGWPGAELALPDWEPAHGLMQRSVGMERDGEGGEELRLEERMLRFPSAPIHGLHRLSQKHVNMGPVESFHTLRLLSKPGKRAKVSRIFLMNNGLNETQNASLYYQLASYLIEEDEDTVCLLRPFPGHLTRCPYPGLSETPLDHYLWDGLHLFRQFLRYMIETRWLLSTLARYSYYHCVVGSGLLGQSRRISDSRLEESLLARMMKEEWESLYQASTAAISRGDGSPEMPAVPRQKAFEGSIAALRCALRLHKYPPQTGATPFKRRGEPELHVLGYSLGGFTAQSVFMSWAFMVSSCATLLSGGAMRELAPTAFADPEEWQTVLHSLRYELDDALMDARFTTTEDGLVAGLEPRLFRYLKRTFYEVFEQEYRGSFQTRLAAFRRRMLFVVGGNDPIVRPQSVLDSGPPDGINLISVGGLGHFLEGVARGKPDEEQHSFWLPEIGRTIGRLATDAADTHRYELARTWLDENDLIRHSKRQRHTWRELSQLSIEERLEVEQGGKLPNHLFQHALDELLVRAVKDEKPGGFLFVLRNEPPTFLLQRRTLQQRGSAMYHEDVGIVNYVREVELRWDVISGEGRDRERICLVLPHNLRTILSRIDAGTQHPSQSESSGEPVWLPAEANKTWTDLRDLCAEQTMGTHRDWIRVFDGSRGNAARQLPTGKGSPDPMHLCEAAREQFKFGSGGSVIPALPDCWIWISSEVLGPNRWGRAPDTISLALARLVDAVPDYLGRKKETLVAEMMRSDALRMVTISRARYNPRFRGRIIAQPRQAQELLLRAALCIATSVRFSDFNFPEPGAA